MTRHKPDAEDEVQRGTRNDVDPLPAIEVTNRPDCEPDAKHERDRAEDDGHPLRFCPHEKIVPSRERERRLGTGERLARTSVTGARVDTAQVVPVPDRAASALSGRLRGRRSCPSWLRSFRSNTFGRAAVHL